MRAGVKALASYDDIKISAELSGLFATTIVYARFADCGDLCADLKAAIAQQRAAQPNIARSNIGGWHSDTKMRDWGGAAAQFVGDKAIAMAKKVTTLSDGDAAQLHWSLYMWANILPSGGLNKSHIHPGQLWSAVFYVDHGDDDPDAGGELVLEDPRFPMTHMRLNALRVMDAGGAPQTGETRLKPKMGDLILFPAWLRHNVEQYHGQRERISIAMNIDARPSSA